MNISANDKTLEINMGEMESINSYLKDGKGNIPK